MRWRARTVAENAFRRPATSTSLVPVVPARMLLSQISLNWISLGRMSLSRIPLPRIPLSGISVAQLLLAQMLLIWSGHVPAGVIITQLANQGIIIEDGAGTGDGAGDVAGDGGGDGAGNRSSTRIMIDGMVVEPYSVYGGLPPELHPAFEQAAGPFLDIDLALASHQHHDHNQPLYACRFMQSSEGTVFASSAQVMDLMREKCREFTVSSPRIEVIEPQYDVPVTIAAGEAQVTVFLLSHGVGKYARLQNFGHLVDIGGFRVLHIGDAAMDATDYARAGVDEMGVDIALIPFWYFQPGPGPDIVERYLDAPHKVAVHVPPGELEEVKFLLQTEYPDVLLLEDALDEVHFETPPATHP